MRSTIVTLRILFSLKNHLCEDNLNGPVGIMVAAAKGVLRSLLCNGEFSGECIPVDFACNGIITIAKSFAEMKSKPKETPVFNITCHPESKKPWGYILQQGREMNKKYPFEVGLWYPGEMKMKITVEIQTNLHQCLGGDITTNEFAVRKIFTQIISINKRIILSH